MVMLFRDDPAGFGRQQAVRNGDREGKNQVPAGRGQAIWEAGFEPFGFAAFQWPLSTL